MVNNERKTLVNQSNIQLIQELALPKNFDDSSTASFIIISDTAIFHDEKKRIGPPHHQHSQDQKTTTLDRKREEGDAASFREQPRWERKWTISQQINFKHPKFIELNIITLKKISRKKKKKKREKKK